MADWQARGRAFIFLAISAKCLCSILIWAGVTPVILGTGLEMGLVQRFEMLCATRARGSCQTRFCAVINSCHGCFFKSGFGRAFM